MSRPSRCFVLWVPCALGVLKKLSVLKVLSVLSVLSVLQVQGALSE